jgi:hypothetical protein
MMKTLASMPSSRRRFLLTTGTAFAVLALAGMSRRVRGAEASGSSGSSSSSSAKIGVIGSGRIGGTLGGLWLKAGHEVMFSSLDLEYDKALAARLGAGAHAGTPKQAAAFGEIILISVPYAALPQLGRDLGDSIKGKVLLDTCNPIPARDGEMANAARATGSGLASARLLPGARLVRAFNSVGYGMLQSEAHRAGERVAIPLAGDDAQALASAVTLVQEAGFEAVVVGPLARAREFDPGTPVFGKAHTAAELRRALAITP